MTCAENDASDETCDEVRHEEVADNTEERSTGGSDGRNDGSSDDRSDADLRLQAENLASQAAAHVATRRAEIIEGTGSGDRRRPSARMKSSDTDPVTILDTESESLIRSAVRESRHGTNDHVFGEEGGLEGNAVHEAGVQWIVDPVDGTVNVIYGVPAYAVSVAAARGSTVVAGAVADVSRGLLYSAHQGGGATVRPLAGGARRRLTCSPETDLGQVLLATGFAYNPDRRRRQAQALVDILPRVRDIRRLGSAALDLCYVADGVMDAYVEYGLNGWDFAAGALIAEEAGAHVCTPDIMTTSDDGELVIAAAPGVAADLKALVSDVAERHFR